jgi:hypothetical protein
MSYVINGQIDKKGAFCGILNNSLPNRQDLITQIISGFDAAIRTTDNVTGSALSNAHGDWYEWLLAISAWNYHIANPDAFMALLMPNVSRFNVSQLYTDELSELVRDLKDKVADAASVRLITSNPDFVLIDPLKLSRPSNLPGAITFIDRNILTQMEELYQHFIGICDFDDIAGYMSVKTSLRPDRRLQIPHEGSLMKAIYTHLQTRQWIINPRGLKYYALSTAVSDADRTALQTVATHSITTVQSVPQAAVDNVFVVNSLDQAEDVWRQILHR